MYNKIWISPTIQATQISNRLETILEKSELKEQVLLLTLRFVIPRFSMFYLAIEIIHLYKLLYKPDESLHSIILANVS